MPTTRSVTFPPSRIQEALRVGNFLDRGVPVTGLKFKDTKWKAATGFIFSKDLAQWKITPLDGTIIKETLEASGLQLGTNLKNPSL